MKVRWTPESIRLRITPSELDALSRETPVRTALPLPGGLTWRVAIVPEDGPTRLTSDGAEVRLHLGPADRRRLAQPDAEGVYFKTESEPPLRYFIEKDFPCAHPRLVDALEAAAETFPPTQEFEERKKIVP